MRVVCYDAHTRVARAHAVAGHWRLTITTDGSACMFCKRRCTVLNFFPKALRKQHCIAKGKAIGQGSRSKVIGKVACFKACGRCHLMLKSLRHINVS